MAIWSTLISKLMEIIKNMIGSRTIQNELHVTYAISPVMEKAIQEWSMLYQNKAPWLREPTDDNPVRIASLGLAALIASEKARTALLEFDSEITAPTEQVETPNPEYPGQIEYREGVNGERVPIPKPLPQETVVEEKSVGDTTRAEYLESQYKKLKRSLRKQMEYGIAKGGLVIKPYLLFDQSTDNDNEVGEETDSGLEYNGTENEESNSDIQMEFDFIQADAFYPLAFSVSGMITEAAFIQSKVEGNTIFRKLEYHKWENNTVTVINKAYKSSDITNSGSTGDLELGEEISLKEVSEWKDLDEKTVIKNVKKPLFAYFKMPEANTIDTTSPLGVSGFSRAVNLIKDADMQYSRLLWEYEGGELAIDIDRDALRTDLDENGNPHTKQNQLQARLYRSVDLGNSGDTYQPFAPTLRDNNYIGGLNTILMRIEDVCGISRGTLSDSPDIARTATELKILKQRSYQTNADIQAAIEETLKDVIYIMNVYCDLYEITPDGNYEVNFEWDDSILVDVDEELTKRLTLMQNGLASRIENRMWYFGETENQAREALAKIDEEAARKMQQQLEAQASQFGNTENEDTEDNYAE